jgi:hypothetical protein
MRLNTGHYIELIADGLNFHEYLDIASVIMNKII